MLLLLLAASLFPTALRVPFPQAQRVAIAGGKVFAASASGKGAVISGGKITATFEAGDNPASIAAMGGDLVIAHHERNYITVHRAPAFAPRQIPVEVRPHTHFAAVGDLDGDGQPDIVVNDMGGKRVIVLWGPDFQQRTAAPTGSKGYAYENVAIAGPRLYVPCWPQPQVAVLRVEGRKITQEKMIELPHSAFWASGEAVAMYSGQGDDPSNDGVFFFAGGKSLDAGRSPVRVASSGGLTAVAALGGTVKLFGAAEATIEVASPEDVAIGDLDGDGKPDLAIAAGDEVILHLSR